MANREKVCPKCKSNNISLWMGGTTGIVYKCNDCDYLGPVVLEKSEK